MANFDQRTQRQNRYCPTCGCVYSSNTFICPHCNMPTSIAKQRKTYTDGAQSYAPVLKRILLIAAVVLAVIAISSAWNHGNFNRLSDAVGTKTAVIKTNLRAQTLRNWNLDITGYEFTDTIASGVNRYFDSGAGETFLLVYVEAKNMGDSKEAFLPVSYTENDLSCEITLSTGKKSETYGITWLIDYSDDIIGQNISPEKTVSGVIAFVVPNDLSRPDTIELVFSQKNSDVTFDLK